jgi:uncharacterized cupin superfamily protein
MNTTPVAVIALDAPPRTKPSNYPEPFRSMMSGRVKRPLGDLFGLVNFGVNITVLPPNSVSALRHTDMGRVELSPGMAAGFKAGTGNAHRLVNESSSEAVYLEVGDRTQGDEVTYPDDDLAARLVGGAWQFTHKDGTPYA